MAGFSTALRNTRSTDIKTLIDSGTAAGSIKFYTATRPATGAAITSQTLLGTAVLNYPCGNSSSGVFTLTVSPAVQDVSADATGTATWARVAASDGTFVMDLSVGTSATELILNSVDFLAGGIITITSLVITEGNA